MKATTLPLLIATLILLIRGILVQECNAKDFVVSNGRDVLLKISSTTEVQACNVNNICEQISDGIQTLSLASDGKSIQISNGNSVTLPDDSPTNEIQQISLSSGGSQLSLSQNGGSADVAQLTCSSGSKALCAQLAEQKALLSSLQAILTELNSTVTELQQGLQASKQQLVGSILPHAAKSVPTGWLLCDGAVVSRTDYASLFAVIGVTYGVGDAVTTFNLPDMRGRSVVGAGAGTGLTNRPVNTVFGAESVNLTISHLPAHNHPGTVTATDGAHDHGTIQARDSSGQYFTVWSQTGGSGGGYLARPMTELANSNGVGAFPWKLSSTAAHAHQVNVASQGTGNAVPTVPPSITFNYVIKF